MAPVGISVDLPLAYVSSGVLLVLATSAATSWATSDLRVVSRPLSSECPVSSASRHGLHHHGHFFIGGQDNGIFPDIRRRIAGIGPNNNDGDFPDIRKRNADIGPHDNLAALSGTLSSKGFGDIISKRTMSADLTSRQGRYPQDEQQYFLSRVEPEDIFPRKQQANEDRVHDLSHVEDKSDNDKHVVEHSREVKTNPSSRSTLPANSDSATHIAKPLRQVEETIPPSPHDTTAPLTLLTVVEHILQGAKLRNMLAWDEDIMKRVSFVHPARLQGRLDFLKSTTNIDADILCLVKELTDRAAPPADVGGSASGSGRNRGNNDGRVSERGAEIKRLCHRSFSTNGKLANTKGKKKSGRETTEGGGAKPDDTSRMNGIVRPHSPRAFVSSRDNDVLTREEQYGTTESLPVNISPSSRIAAVPGGSSVSPSTEIAQPSPHPTFYLATLSPGTPAPQRPTTPIPFTAEKHSTTLPLTTPTVITNFPTSRREGSTLKTSETMDTKYDFQITKSPSGLPTKSPRSVHARSKRMSNFYKINERLEDKIREFPDSKSLPAQLTKPPRSVHARSKRMSNLYKTNERLGDKTREILALKSLPAQLTKPPRSVYSTTQRVPAFHAFQSTKRSAYPPLIFSQSSPLPWTCPSTTRWRDLGNHVFPRYVQETFCGEGGSGEEGGDNSDSEASAGNAAGTCWYGYYTCQPRSSAVQVLVRHTGHCNDSRVPHNMRGNYFLSVVELNTGCECA